MQISNIVGKIFINGKEFIGKCVSILNGKAFVDGKEVNADINEKVINITINGDCGPVENGVGDIRVYGKVEGYVEVGVGDVQSGDVLGHVQVGTGDIKCGPIDGNVNVGCGNITSKR